jgi:hypothetical protein
VLDFVVRHKYGLSTAFLLVGLFFLSLDFYLAGQLGSAAKSTVAIQSFPIRQDGRTSELWALPPRPRPPFSVVVTGNTLPIPATAQANSTIDLTLPDLSIDHITDSQGLLLKGPHDPWVSVATELFGNANMHLRDGSLSLVLDLPGATILPKSNKLVGTPIHFLVRATDNKDGDFVGRFSFEGQPKDMNYLFEGKSLSLHVSEHHSIRETASWYFTFLGPGFTVSGILGFLFGWLLPKPAVKAKLAEEEDDPKKERKKKKKPTKRPSA